MKNFFVKIIHYLFSLNNITLSQSKIQNYFKGKFNRVVEIESVSINLDLNSAEKSDFYLNSHLTNGGNFSLSGNFSLAALKSNLKFQLDEVSLLQLAPYLIEFSYLIDKPKS